jgi:hypothetical protein
MPAVPDATLLATLFRTVGAIRPDPDSARSWVERELSRPEYERSLLERFFGWLGELWDRLTQTALDASPLSTGAAVLVLVALVGLAVAAAGRLRREQRGPRQAGGAVVAQGDSPDAHRAAAERALESGDDARALVEAFRALASRSARRGLVLDRPGLTAHEVATELGRVFDARSAELTAAAGLFDGIFYGAQPARPGDARAVLDLDDDLGRSRPHHDVAVDGAVR